MFVAAVYVSATVDNDANGGDYWGFSVAQLSAISLAGFAAGCVVRRLQAISLALLPLAVAIPFGFEDGGAGLDLSHDRVIELVAWPTLICAGFIVAGVVAAAAIRFIQRRGSAPAPG